MPLPTPLGLPPPAHGQGPHFHPSELLPPCPWSRTPCQPPGAMSPCPRNAAARPVSSSPEPCLAMDLVEPGPVTGPHPNPAPAHPQGGTQCLGLGLPCCLLATRSWLGWWTGPECQTLSATLHGEPPQGLGSPALRGQLALVAPCHVL